MGFKYTLATSDGELFGEGEWAFQPRAGDVLHIEGNRRIRVVSAAPREKIGEFVDGDGGYGLLEVEPVP